MDDPTTTAAEGFGLMFYNARWYDPTLGRFAQADSLIPLQTQGVQAWDRYAYVNNNPLRYTDPSGHLSRDEIKKMLGVETWKEVLLMFDVGGELENHWGLLEALRKVEVGDTIYGVNYRGPRRTITHPDDPLGMVVQSNDGSLYIQNAAGETIPVSSLACYPVYASNKNGKRTTYGNGHYYSHIEIDTDVSLVTLGMDIAGIGGSFFGLGWASNSKKVTNLGNAASWVSSSYGIFESAYGDTKPDWFGITFSAGGLIPGPAGVYSSVVVFLSDFLYEGR